MNAVYRRRRKIAGELIGDVLNCDFSEQQAGMFLWARVPGQYQSGFELSDKVLRESKVFLTPGGIFGTAGDKYVRISLCSPEEKFEQSIQRIRSTIKSTQTI